MRKTIVGLSMIELVISLTLFSVIMAAVLQAMVSTTNYVEFDATRTDLQTESMIFQKEVVNDLANAAWFYSFNSSQFRYERDTNNQRIALYPAVGSGGSSLEFLKLRTSLTIENSPAELRYAQTNFRDTAAAPVRFSEYPDSLPTPLMVLNPGYRADPDWYVASVWESFPGANGSRSFLDNQNPERLRHYLYCIEVGADGSRNLVRKYLNGHSNTPPAMPAISAWNLDSVLLRDVETVRFSTTTQDANLNENQIRIQITMRRSSSRSAITGVKVSRTLDFIAAMRSFHQESN